MPYKIPYKNEIIVHEKQTFGTVFDIELCYLKKNIKHIGSSPYC